MTAEPSAAAREEWVSVAEACRQLNIGKPKFYEFLAAGEFTTLKLPPHNQQARRKVAQSSIDAFVERNKQPAST
jgi:excisionase family DNA binding protein